MQDICIEWRHSAGMVDYREAVSFMEAQVAAIREGSAPQTIWLLEHPPLYTAGTSAKAQDLLDHAQFPVHYTGRGGQYTYHGPGQRIAYVMLDMKQPSPFRPSPDKAPDIRAFVTFLEQWIIHTLRRFGLEGRTYADRVGVWVDDGEGSEAKIAAIGIRVRGGVTYHGIAINLNPDLSHFAGIVPCGIREYGVTSFHALGVNIPMEILDKTLEEEFNRLYCERD